GLAAEPGRATGGAAGLRARPKVRSRFLGRKSALAALLHGIGALPPAERGPAGERANAAKERIEALLRARRQALERAAQDRQLGRRLDVTLPGRRLPRGGLHPITRVEREVVDFFHGLGFSIEEGPEVETEYNNFEALNIPP